MLSWHCGLPAVRKSDATSLMGPTPIMADRVMDGEAAGIIPWVGLI
jgi:hypothetical protein